MNNISFILKTKGNKILYKTPMEDKRQILEVTQELIIL